MWTALLLVSMLGLFVQTAQLEPYYQEMRAVPGGTYREGVLGNFTNANPLYARGSVDGAVSKMVFSGLFTYNEYNQLVGDLAIDYEFDEDGIEYVVRLREDVRWHDGEPFTAEDVVFTYETIASPDARSPLFSSWKNTDVEALDAYTVLFTLPSPLASFPPALTNGIVPKHILQDVPPRQLRSHTFNTAYPIGTGPFTWDAIEVVGPTPETREERIALRSYDDYHNGKPNINRFVLRTFQDEERLIENFIDRDVHAIAGIDSISPELLEGQDYHSYVVPLTGQVGVFFKSQNPVFKNKRVRQALVQYIDTEAVRSSLDGPVVPSDSPLLAIHQEYDEERTQLPHNPKRATKLLKKAKWEKNDDGMWEKDGETLSFSIVALNSPDGRDTTQALQKQWHDQGVEVNVKLQDDTDLQTTIAQHDYTALMHGISIGTDPDVFAFWHSSQAKVVAENRLNLSDYSSDTADASLESGRTRSDDELRSLKYQPFLEAWRADAPALMLYQPRFIYITQSPVDGFDPLLFNSGTDRMYSIDDWYIRRAMVDK